MKGQSAIEFLSVYGFMFIVLGVVIAILVFFSAIPNNIIPSQCSPFGGLNCLGAFYYSNVSKGYSLVILRLSNAQSVPVNIISANVIVNTIDYAAAGNCTPAYVQPGQQFMCQIEFPRSLNPYISAKANYFISLQFCSQALSLQNKSNCDLYSDNVIYGGAISATVTPISIHYLPITLANSQSTPANTPFQEMISFNSISSGYDSYESANITNIEFTTGPRAQGAQIQAWIESGASSHAANTVVWLNLPFTIPAGASNTIYMNFLPFPIVSSSGPTGMAPQLSPTYAEYDNGADIFTNYWNFAGTSLPGSFITAGTGSYSQNDGITVTASSTVNYEIIASVSPGSILVDSLMELTSSTNGNIEVGYGGGSSTYTLDDGYTLNFATGYNNLYKYVSGTSSVIATGSQTLTTAVYSLALSTTPSQIGYQNYASVGSATDSSLSLSNFHQFAIGAASSGSIQLTWLRTRAYPPGGIMPSATFGSVTS